LAGPRRNTKNVDTLEDFLAALRRPLEFLLNAPPATVARTHLPGVALALRARELADAFPGDLRRGVLESLAQRLESFESASADQRGALARQLWEGLESLAQRPAPPPYRVSKGDLHGAVEQLQRPVQFVRGVGPRRAELLRKSGIQTVEDLLFHLPFRYEDRRRVSRIGEACPGEEASFLGEIAQLTDRTVGRARRRILEGVLKDESGLLGLTWYNQVTYFRSRYRVGQRCLVYGRVERTPAGGTRIVHPEIDVAPDEAGPGILPVYNKPTTMTVGAMRKLVQQAVQDFADLMPSALPPQVTEPARLLDLAAALRAVHLPQADADVDELNAFRSEAHRSLVFDELFFLQLGLSMRRRETKRESGISMRGPGQLTNRLRAQLPFALTGAQERVLAEIQRDMAMPHPMNRLVQGDVGSGKTMVALMAALLAIENGYQAAFLAPTELLAEQHYRTVSWFSAALGISTVLLTGQVPRSEKAAILDGLAAGDTPLVIGTHALIQDKVRIKNLGLGVIDEQHRFGVLQRAALRTLGAAEAERSPHILLMTATPIPRTLSMTVYGDLDVSALDELPPGRKPVRTLIFSQSQRQRVYDLVRQELERGHQGYVVYPLVESSEKEDLQDATTMARELGRTVFPNHRVGLVHGRMKGDEKDAVMRRFRAGDLHLLVSTTVIEVGVDVPNATVMVVEHAERFGLSQLHQLRGRVGRGSDRATCLLIAPYHRGGDVGSRLEAMRDTSDGFRIAEVDLQLRGPGEFLGTRQSGLPDFRVVNLLRDSRLLAEARRSAEQWMEGDPGLQQPESDAMKIVLKQRWAKRLGLADVG
jgi:ATP-dependent DNA helicase RecG